MFGINVKVSDIRKRDKLKINNVKKILDIDNMIII